MKTRSDNFGWRNPMLGQHHHCQHLIRAVQQPGVVKLSRKVKHLLLNAMPQILQYTQLLIKEVGPLSLCHGHYRVVKYDTMQLKRIEAIRSWSHLLLRQTFTIVTVEFIFDTRRR